MDDEIEKRSILLSIVVGILVVVLAVVLLKGFISWGISEMISSDDQE